MRRQPEIELHPCTFDIEIVRLVSVDALPGSWVEADYRQILEALDYADASPISAAEVEDMAVMALQELQPDEAAALVLKQRAGDLFNPGQIQNLSHEMQDEPVWEEYPDLAAHECLFLCTNLLNRSFPGNFPATEMHELEIRIKPARSMKPSAFTRVNEATWLIRLLAKGMNENAILLRMFEEQLTGGDFPEAEFLLWKILPQSDPGHLIVQTSSHWLRGLPEEGAFSANLKWPES